MWITKTSAGNCKFTPGTGNLFETYPDRFESMIKFLQSRSDPRIDMNSVFIDGQAGTTGLLIHDYLQDRTDLELISVPDAARKDPATRRDAMREADVVILCLPDQAAREAVALSPDGHTRFIDASTAHRVDASWVYGLPELREQQRDLIRSARRVSNPGCYATGFLLAIAPLTEAGLLDPAAPLTISALSGYSGGGRNMIEKYEQRSTSQPGDLWYSRPYALKPGHKHLPEMQRYAGLEKAPVFLPSVGHFRQGMLVTTGLFAHYLTRKADTRDIHDLLSERYRREPCVRVLATDDEGLLADGFLEPQSSNGTNSVDILVFGNDAGEDSQFILVARLDNLGKGAAGAAVQNLNLMLGAPELEGLKLVSDEIGQARGAA